MITTGGPGMGRDMQLNKEMQVSPMRALKVAQATRLIGVSFFGSTIDSSFWTSTVADNGTNTQANGQMTLRTNTTANGSATITSVRIARYIAAHSNTFRAVVRLPDAGSANNVRRWGAYDDNDGFFFQLSGTTFGIGSRKGAADDVVTSASFNGTIPTLTTNATTYDIIYTNSNAWFFVNDVLVHTKSAPTTPQTDTLHLKARAQNTNSGSSTTDLSLEVRVMSVSRFGHDESRPTSSFINANGTTVLKRGPGTLHRVVIGTKGAISNTLTLYDNTAASGTIISIVDTVNSTSDLEFDLDFNIGLTAVLATGTVAGVTVVFD